MPKSLVGCLLSSLVINLLLFINVALSLVVVQATGPSPALSRKLPQALIIGAKKCGKCSEFNLLFLNFVKLTIKIICRHTSSTQVYWSSLQCERCRSRSSLFRQILPLGHRVVSATNALIERVSNHNRENAKISRGQRRTATCTPIESKHEANSGFAQSNRACHIRICAKPNKKEAICFSFTARVRCS